MKPISFEEQNRVLQRPDGMTAEECGSLPVFANEKMTISKWKGSFKDRLKFLFTGKLWLFVWYGTTQPPVNLSSNYPFERRKR